MHLCSSVLMYPAEILWNRFINPPPIVGNHDCVQKIALRTIALVGAIVCMPAYFIGLTLKTISRFYERAARHYISPIEQRPVTLPIEQRSAEAPIHLDSPEIRDAAHSLELIRQFKANPTWENYQNLPLDQKYLVAGRYTYPNYWGWSFTTKFTLTNVFETKFRAQRNLAGEDTWIHEAVRIQEKILFTHKLKQALIQRADLTPLQNQDRDTFNQALHYIGREYECRRNEDAIRIGMDMLTTRPDDPKTGDALNFMIYHLKEAHAPADLPSMHPEPARIDPACK